MEQIILPNPYGEIINSIAGECTGIPAFMELYYLSREPDILKATQLFSAMSEQNRSLAIAFLENLGPAADRPSAASITNQCALSAQRVERR